MKGIHWFSLYNLFALLGALAVALRGTVSDFLSIVGGNLLVVGGYLFLFLSLAELFGHKPRYLYVQVGLVFVCLVTMLQYGSFHPDTSYRLVAYSLVLAGQQGAIAIFLYTRGRRVESFVAKPMMLVLACVSLVNLARVVGVFYLGAPSDYLRAGMFLQWILIATSSLQCAVIMSYVWMSAALLRRDLEIQASTDPLTGVLNRRALEVAVEKELAAWNLDDAPICAIFIDLDGFKQINDIYGHLCGDATLVSVAETLRKGIRAGDHLGRLGGDEFAILLARTPIEEAVVLAEQLRSAIEALEVVHESTSVKVTGSFGLAQIETTRLNWDQLSARCDQALYRVKRSGGNLICPASV